jgi:hypothetical protein
MTTLRIIPPITENLPNSEENKPPGIVESPQSGKDDEHIATKDTYNNNVEHVTVTNFINLPPILTEPYLPNLPHLPYAVPSQYDHLGIV